MSDKTPMQSSEDNVKRLKETGQKMDMMQKILYLRCTRGLGLAEAHKELMNTGNYFDGPWRDLKESK